MRSVYQISTASLSFISGEKNVSDVASIRDGQAAQATSSQQLQQHDTVETFRQKYLSSGKFNFSSFWDDYILVVVELCLLTINW